LALLIAEQIRIDQMRALEITKQILSALEHAHANGIVHRDVKPGNVLVRQSDESVKLVDFGLAFGVADVVRHTGPENIIGSVWYMSPEQASGSRRLDFRTDLFSVGAVLFELLTGAISPVP
jgi:serine/threonine protein kinase